jgi:hypothetical protein
VVVANKAKRFRKSEFAKELAQKSEREERYRRRTAEGGRET